MEIPNTFDLLTLPFRGAYESAKDLITPKSHAEALVDEIYGGPSRGLPMPEELTQYFPEDAEKPQVFVETTQAVKKAAAAAVDSLTSATKKYLIIGAVVLLVLVFVYGLAGGLARR